MAGITGLIPSRVDPLLLGLACEVGPGSAPGHTELTRVTRSDRGLTFVTLTDRQLIALREKPSESQK